MSTLYLFSPFLFYVMFLVFTLLYIFPSTLKILFPLFCAFALDL
jgi:hypothetical protein